MAEKDGEDEEGRTVGSIEGFADNEEGLSGRAMARTNWMQRSDKMGVTILELDTKERIALEGVDHLERGFMGCEKRSVRRRFSPIYLTFYSTVDHVIVSSSSSPTTSQRMCLPVEPLWCPGILHFSADFSRCATDKQPLNG